MPVTIAPAWPEPYLQPDVTRDCSFYATAYAARCLGYSNTTAQDVMAWREETGYHEDSYLKRALGLANRSWWDFKDVEEVRLKFWLGPEGRPWVEHWLSEGWIGLAYVHRVPHMAHVTVVLDADDSGVLLMDPVFGHVVEPWDWFLGIGPGTYGCHRVSPWVRGSRDGD